MPPATSFLLNGLFERAGGLDGDFEKDLLPGIGLEIRLTGDFDLAIRLLVNDGLLVLLFGRGEYEGERDIVKLFLLHDDRDLDLLRLLLRRLVKLLLRDLDLSRGFVLPKGSL